MSATKSDRAWQRMGAIDPYYGVIPYAGYRRTNLDDSERTEFFRSGERDVEATMETIRQHVDRNFRPRRVLDYGCGVGRVLVHLARRAEQAVGCDVSPGMLEEAQTNCARYGVDNVQFVRADDDRGSALRGTFDFIYSDGVFQHIAPARVDVIVRGLLDRLDDGGIAALGFVTDAPTVRRVGRWVKRNVPGFNAVVEYVRGSQRRIGVLESHVYPLDRVMKTLRRCGYTEMHVMVWDGPHATRARVFVQRISKTLTP